MAIGEREWNKPFGVGDVAPLTEYGELVLQQLAEALPHGSGIDSEWYLKETTVGTFWCSASFHAMDEVGYYCCWNDFTAIVEIKPNGRYWLKRLMFHGDPPHVELHGLREYLEDTIHYAVSEQTPPAKPVATDGSNGNGSQPTLLPSPDQLPGIKGEPEVVAVAAPAQVADGAPVTPMSKMAMSPSRAAWLAACQTSGISTKLGNLGPYTGLDRMEDKSFPNGREFVVILCRAYNAMGLIGSEYNGVAVMDKNGPHGRHVLLDRVKCAQTGYFGPSWEQWQEFDRIMAMDWPTFQQWANGFPEGQLRYKI